MPTKIPAKLQQRVAAEAQQERHAPKYKGRASDPGFRVKDPKRLIKSMKASAEIQQRRGTPSVKPPAENPNWELSKGRKDLPVSKKPAAQLQEATKIHKHQGKVKAQLAREAAPQTAPKPAPKPATPSKPGVVGRLRKAAGERIGQYKAERAAAKEAYKSASKVGKVLIRGKQAFRAAKAVGKFTVGGILVDYGVTKAAETAIEGVKAVRAASDAKKHKERVMKKYKLHPEDIR